MRDGGEDGLISGLQPCQSSRFPRAMLLFPRSSLQAILPELTNLLETRAFTVYRRNSCIEKRILTGYIHGA